MILLLLLVSVMCEPMEWTQLESPNGGLMSFMYQPFDTLIPSILDKTRFKIFTPVEGDAIINDAMVYINWKTYTRSDGLFPTDVKISLYSVPGLSKDMEPNEVSVLAHSIYLILKYTCGLYDHLGLGQTTTFIYCVYVPCMMILNVAIQVCFVYYTHTHFIHNINLIAFV